MRELGITGIPEGRRIELPWQALRWTRRGKSEPWAVVEFRLEMEAHSGTAWLRYDVHHVRPTGPQRYPVSMVTTPCRFGGQRWRWICPATYRWVSNLYLPNGGTGSCRGPGGYRLGYACQRGTWLDRAHMRARRLHRKLGGDYSGMYTAIPGKPKGMHWRTYAQITAELSEVAAQIDRGFVQGAERARRRSGWWRASIRMDDAGVGRRAGVARP